MQHNYFTIGMAGHIDHGKTALTKALTKVDTDRLKEEKERNISIEPGFAPLKLKNKSTRISIIDVPGHEKFIRQMISGVAGIDLVLIVIAGDEGIMPQTKEHMDILSLLGIEEAIIVITKTDLIDEELKHFVKEDVLSYIKNKSYRKADILFVDSLTGKGIRELEQLIEQKLSSMKPRSSKGSFRMPVDQSFTIKGQGTIVRGTIYEGTISTEEIITLLPEGKKARIRQMQVQHEPVTKAYAGQRAAINLADVEKEEVNRGNVMVKSDHFLVTTTIDVFFQVLQGIRHPIKQRSQVNIYTGTSEVTGTIILFDRNEIKDGETEIYCQFRLAAPVVVRRGDRFILRRPTPAETVGGGLIIDPKGQKYKFGDETVQKLKEKSKQSPEEIIESLLSEHGGMNEKDLLAEVAITKEYLRKILSKKQELGKLLFVRNGYILTSSEEECYAQFSTELQNFHKTYPLRLGKNKPEAAKALPFSKEVAAELIEKWIKEGKIIASKQFLAVPGFQPYFPPEWETSMERLEEEWMKDGLEVDTWKAYGNKHGIPEKWMDELAVYYRQTGGGWQIDDKHLISMIPIRDKFQSLYGVSEDLFSLKEAKEIFSVSRKYLVPLLEKSDENGLTIRKDGMRKWLKSPDAFFKDI
ncbi:selenocysteine-specific translation elongation factor [Thalassobacillus pellis]|uniref:selenocysteine-specific translation elongation factor n=1 Tax=Thalassobacillus pellis TaxID=748008 RepID=UPI0019614D0C|nr:selenocysteine-specific translation elongation factor [Thalassobacillus pellis]MBM7552634.1 selenocysteine-specific elongation factor [Thalassobacillus pellis]